MLWNTAYGMMSAPHQLGSRRAGQAVRIVDRWFDAHHTGLRAAEPDPFGAVGGSVSRKVVFFLGTSVPPDGVLVPSAIPVAR
ncbi:hypothetical protein [Nonomuraea jabiensis]|uniref:hypothetical protein n=1 Tax=Nonomuraea jabiensis TaxID=882448 RepID=UPI003D73C581